MPNAPICLPLIFSCLVTLAVAPGHAETLEVRLQDGSPAVFNDFERPFVFAYGSFKGEARVEDGVARIVAANGKGGAGHTVTRHVVGLADQTPVLVIRLGPTNRAAKLRLVCDDAKKRKRVFEYDLGQATAEGFTAIFPVHAKPLDPTVLGEPDDGFDPTRIIGHHLQGDWRDERVDVRVDRIELRKPRSEHADQRRAYLTELERRRAEERRKAERLAAQRERQLAETEHHPDGPRVMKVGAIDRDVLAIRLMERTHVRRGQVAYEAQAGDSVERNSDKTVLAWADGRPGGEAVRAPMSRSLKRQLPGQGRPQGVGTLLANGKMLAQSDQAEGRALTQLTVGEPEAYRVVSQDDSRYHNAVTPLAVGLKAKPVGQSREVWVYLTLPEPMRDGASYTVRFQGVNTAKPEARVVFDTRSLRSPAIQASHVGYRPNDPFKRAFLSQWTGTGGPHNYGDHDRFELINEQGQTVHRDEIVTLLEADDAENLHGQNRTKTQVNAMDFAEFRQPGTYRVHVPGIGVSHPFVIADDAWANAFSHAMRGLLAHRSGIALPKSLMGYERPRPMHPDDGFVVYQTDIATWNGESAAIHKSLSRLLGEGLDTGRLEKVPNAWGGYMDAGDWDRRSQHLEATYRLLELYAMFPERMAKVRLTLPKAEAGNRIPDVLDEAMWNVAFFERMQQADGGVRGGIESTEHPRSGEASWQESLLVGAFIADPQASHRFAASAALLARLLEPHDPARARELTRNAERAYRWAVANLDRTIERTIERGMAQDRATHRRGEVRNARALAAVQLYALTGKRAYHDDFRAVTTLGQPGDPTGQLDAHFAYATLPRASTDPTLAEQARAAVIGEADKAMAFGRGNAYGLSHRVDSLPMMGWVGYYSVPEAIIGPTLPRAHYLTQDPRYLAAALRAAHYGVGANPMNMTMTTGLGHAYPQHVLHVDSTVTGQPAPDGITVYGPHDPARTPPWVDRWFLRDKLVPQRSQWPAAEWYIDLGNWPEMTEYTVHQTIGPVAYYWGYLAARP